MSVSRAYLDHNATSPIRPEVAVAMANALSLPGNPSSVHAEGRAARAVVETARDHVSALIGARSRDVFFTSGGTEAAATVLTPGLRRAKCAPSLLLILATEHVCVRDGHRFEAGLVETIPVDRAGIVDLVWLEARLARHEGMAIVSVHAANNETGVIEPLIKISTITKRYNAILYTDAVQMVGRVAFDAKVLGVDVVTFSAHKSGGPKGVGAVVMMDASLSLDDRLIKGGGQERSLRAGTENVAAIAGFGAASKVALHAMQDDAVRIGHLRDEFERRLMAMVPQATIFGQDAPRLPNTSAFAIPGFSAERALILLDLNNVSVSSGSACSSGKVHRSHVLAAMDVGDALAEAALRVSFGWTSTNSDVELCLAALQKAVSAEKNKFQAAA